MSRTRASGVSLIEAMAALALASLAVTAGGSVLFDAARIAARHEAAAERLVAAERLMERTLAQRFEAQTSQSIAPGAREIGRRRDLGAAVTVRSAAPGLKRIEVVVRDRHGRTRLVALSAPWEGGR